MQIEKGSVKLPLFLCEVIAMKPVLIGAGFLFLIGNEILSWMAVLMIGIAFLATIVKERIEK